MTEHYYSAKPSSAHQIAELETVLLGRKFRFKTDAGVFSKSGVDFGTRLLIETMDIPNDAKVLDVGCGYGPIGIAAATIAVNGAVVMADVNERAIELAEANSKLNGLYNVTVRQSDLFSGIEDREFNCILTNPPIRSGKETVHRIFEQAREFLKDGGSLWVVIQKKQGAPSAMEKLERLYPIVKIAVKDKGYWIIRALK
jgi:16S rRNA (guanine1207-N2)-methyltransferase